MNSKTHKKSINAIYRFPATDSKSIAYKQHQISQYYEMNQNEMDDSFLLKRHRTLTYQQSFEFSIYSGAILGLVFGAISSLLLTSISEVLTRETPTKNIFMATIVIFFTVAILSYIKVFRFQITRLFIHNDRIYIVPLELKLIVAELERRGITIPD